MRTPAPEPAADPRRSVPSVDRVLARLTGLPPALLADCARDAVDAARDRATTGATVTEAAVVADAQRRAPTGGPDSCSNAS